MEDASLVIQNARMASIANEYLGNIIEKKRNNLWSQMKTLCGSGNHDVVKYASMINSIITLDDLQVEIRRQIGAANQREKEIIDNEHTKQ